MKVTSCTENAVRDPIQIFICSRTSMISSFYPLTEARSCLVEAPLLVSQSASCWTASTKETRLTLRLYIMSCNTATSTLNLVSFTFLQDYKVSCCWRNGAFYSSCSETLRQKDDKIHCSLGAFRLCCFSTERRCNRHRIFLVWQYNGYLAKSLRSLLGNHCQQGWQKMHPNNTQCTHLPVATFLDSAVGYHPSLPANYVVVPQQIPMVARLLDMLSS